MPVTLKGMMKSRSYFLLSFFTTENKEISPSKCGYRFHNPLGQVVDLAAVEENALSRRPYPDQERSVTSMKPAKKVGSRKRKEERVMGDLKNRRMWIKQDPADLCVMVIYPPVTRRD